MAAINTPKITSQGKLPHYAEVSYDNLNFIHPYGSLGPLEKPSVSTTTFGTLPSGLWEASENIKTFSEKVDDPQMTETLQSWMEHAEQIVFLGFGFHEQNMQLLHSKNNIRQVYGTAFKESDPNIRAYKNRIIEFLMNDFYKDGLDERRMRSDNDRIHLEKNMDCKTFLEQYSQLIMG
jgi:hypothetical protein